MPKQMNPNAVPVLKDVLSQAYWYKTGLRTFLNASLPGSNLIARADWNGYKRAIVADIVDPMVARQDLYLEDLVNLLLATADIEDPYWLKDVEDGQAKYDEAVVALGRLRTFADPYRRDRTQREEAERQARQKTAEIVATRAMREEISKLRDKLQEITLEKPQERGYSLERLLNQLFLVLDIDSRRPFRIKGEQIDGAFSLDKQEFLVEAKWTEGRIGLADLDAFSAKIGRKLDNTLGLFLSMNGFEGSAVDTYSQRRSTIILMDGADLYSVLDGRIDLPFLLDRKRRYASQTGIVFLPVSAIVAGWEVR